MRELSTLYSGTGQGFRRPSKSPQEDFASEFSGADDWILASPPKIGRLWWELERGTHAFRHTYRSSLDAVGTPVAVQQKDDAPRGHQNHIQHLR